MTKGTVRYPRGPVRVKTSKEFRRDAKKSAEGALRRIVKKIKGGS
jgi:hypothetical protein